MSLAVSARVHASAVNITEVIDLLRELLPGRVRRLIGLAFVLLSFVSSSAAASMGLLHG
jgi:hypothetical protein